MQRPVSAVLVLSAAALLAGCGAGDKAEEAPISMLAPGLTPAALEARVAQFAPARIDFDDSSLEPWEREVLKRLIQASDIMHEIFTRQVSPRNPEWLARLEAEHGAGRDAALAYFDIMVGPWDRLENDAPFLDVGEKPAGAGYYPEDLTAEELNAWLEAHPEDRDAFTSYFTVIRRTEDGGLEAVPYSEAYRDELTRAAALLREAADLSRNESLSRYLRARADAFLSDDYFESDVAWMDITGSRIEPTIGPYEVYEDRLMGYKAAFESFVTVSDPQASAELERLKEYLPELERRLPIEDRYKNLDRGFESPIRVADEVYTGGDTRAGVQTIAFALPNDERVRAAKGSKKVMLRNVMRAKFEQILVPIAREVIDPALVEDVTFDPWFVNVLMHELAHGMGPGFITLPSGERTTVNQALREHYSALEEAKADITGLHNITMLAADGMYDDAFVRRAFLGHFADMFRAVRFGAGAAHGMANLIQFNYLWERGAIRYDPETGRFGADVDALIAGNRELATLLLTIQATGDYDKAGEVIARYGTMRPEMRAALDRLAGTVPVDIKPVYTIVEKMKNW